MEIQLFANDVTLDCKEQIVSSDMQIITLL